MEATITLINLEIESLKQQMESKPPNYDSDPEIRRICDVANSQLLDEINQHQRAIAILEYNSTKQ